MDNANDGIVLRTPADLVKAMNAMLLQMNRPQRKGFLKWVKEKRRQYDFQYPQGYKPPPAEVPPVVDVPKTELLVPNAVDPNGTVEIIKP